MDLTSVLALHQAAKQNVYENIISLINIGAEVDERDAKSGQTALHIAAALNNVEAVKALLDAGAELGVVDCEGDTPLALARKCNKPESALLLEGAEAAGLQRRDSNDSSSSSSSSTSSSSSSSASSSSSTSSTSSAVASSLGRRKMKLHLESGTALFEQPPAPTVSSGGPPSPSAPRGAAPTFNRTVSPPARKPLPAVHGSAVGPCSPRATAGPAGTPSSVMGKPSAGTSATTPRGAPPLSSSDDGDSRIGTPTGGWKKKEWSDVPGSSMAAIAAAAGGGASKPLGGEHVRSRGKSDAFAPGSHIQDRQQQREQDGWKKMKNFFSTSAHPLPSTTTTSQTPPPSPHPQTIEALQSQLQRETMERLKTEQELKEFKKRAGHLMYQLKQRYVECYESNKNLGQSNEKLAQELAELKNERISGTPTKPSVPPRADRKELSSPTTPRDGPEQNDFMTRERQLEAKEKKEWRNTRMMMLESHKTEKLELMAQVEELKDKLKNLTKDLLEVLDENEKLVKQLETVEEERDRCVKLLESKIS